MRLCPNTETFLSFSARDQWNNKLAGEFVFLLYVNGSLDNSIKIHPSNIPYDTATMVIPPVVLTNHNQHTNSNKRVNFFVGKLLQNGAWFDGFDLQTNNIELVARFKNGPFSPWVQESFYLKSNPVEPGRAVVQGASDLYFCSGNEIKTVVLPDFPSESNNPDYFFFIMSGSGNSQQVGK